MRREEGEYFDSDKFSRTIAKIKRGKQGYQRVKRLPIIRGKQLNMGERRGNWDW